MLTQGFALDIEVNDELEVEGRARDFVRLVQQARREADLVVSDRIELAVRASEPWIVAIEAHRELIAGETLATSLLTEQIASDDDAVPVITLTVAG